MQACISVWAQAAAEHVKFSKQHYERLIRVCLEVQCHEALLRIILDVSTLAVAFWVSCRTCNARLIIEEHEVNNNIRSDSITSLQRTEHFLILNL